MRRSLRRGGAFQLSCDLGNWDARCRVFPMNRALLAVAFVLTSCAVAFGQQIGGGALLTPSTALSPPLFTPPGQLAETLQARGLFQTFVGDFAASGSGQTT